MADDAPSALVSVFDISVVIKATELHDRFLDDLLLDTGDNASIITLNRNRQPAADVLNEIVRNELSRADGRQRHQGRGAERGVLARLAYDADILSEVRYAAGSLIVSGTLTFVLGSPSPKGAPLKVTSPKVTSPKDATLTSSIVAALADALNSLLAGAVRKWIEEHFSLSRQERDGVDVTVELRKAPPPPPPAKPSRFQRQLLALLVIITLLLAGVVAALGYMLSLRLF